MPRFASPWRALLAAALLAPASLAHAQSASQADRYLEIPLRGGFGAEITADGLGDALDYAKKAKIPKIVLVMDSPGGYVIEADAIAKLMQKYDAEFEYIAVIAGEAFSASLFVLANADEIYSTSRSAAGAAVAFTGDASSGHAAVDAKFNAAMASNLVGMAEAKSLPGPVVRAMVVPEAALFAHKTEAGAYEFSGDAPKGAAADAWRSLDSDKTVLALAHKELVELGLTRALPSDDASKLDGVPSLAGFKSAGNRGQQLVEAAAKKRTKLKTDIEALAAEINSGVRDAASKDPRTQDYMFRESSGLLTGQSQVQWRENADRAIAAYSAVAKAIQKLRNLEKQAKAAGAEFLLTGVDIAKLDKTVDEQIDWLRANRTKYYHGR